MSKGNGKSVARGVPGAHGEGAGQAGQVSKGSKPDSSHVRGSGDFVFDMRVLGRGPGAFRDEKRTASAPDGLGSGLVLVPAGGDVALDLRFEAVSEGVLVTGSAVGPLPGEGSRCPGPPTTADHRDRGQLPGAVPVLAGPRRGRQRRGRTFPRR